MILSDKAIKASTHVIPGGSQAPNQPKASTSSIKTLTDVQHQAQTPGSCNPPSRHQRIISNPRLSQRRSGTPVRLAHPSPHQSSLPVVEPADRQDRQACLDPKPSPASYRSYRYQGSGVRDSGIFPLPSPFSLLPLPLPLPPPTNQTQPNYS